MRLILAISCAVISGCSAPPEPDPQQLVELSLVDIENTPTSGCIAITRGPDRFEQVERQVQVVPEERSANGELLNPAVFRNEIQRVRIESDVVRRFETLCPPRYTVDFVTSLQRALQARGDFTGSVTGLIDEPTRAAIQRYQHRQGLNSAVLSLETAQALGLARSENS